MKSNDQILRKHVRTAFTLVEMLIAMALTLILVYAIAEFYAYIGNAVRDGRATIEMGGQLRAVTSQLNDDLQSLTLRPTPWVDPRISSGYFSAYEFPGYDADPEGDGINTVPTSTSLTDDSSKNRIPDLIENNNVTTLFGDGDDVLAFTIRAKDNPYQGRNNVTSQFAEVIWFTTFVDQNANSTWNVGEYRFLCRKLLLIRPDLGTIAKFEEPDEMFDFWETNDISVHFVQGEDPPMSGDIDYFAVANSLADLSLRRNRYGCNLMANAPRNQGAAASINYSHPNFLDINPNNAPSVTMYTLQGAGFGEDRVLSNVLAFDVRVWDPEARIYQATNANGGTIAVTAGDPGYAAVATRENSDPLSTAYSPLPPQLTTPISRLSTLAPTIQGLGAWVDLNYNQGLQREAGAKIAYTHFSGLRPSPPTSYVAPELGFSVWDTWPLTFENDGVNQDGDTTMVGMTSVPLIDESVNGLDDDGQNGVDDPGERETRAPHPFPLRGIQVRIRMYEPQTRQMRQATVGADFVGD